LSQVEGDIYARVATYGGDLATALAIRDRFVTHKGSVTTDIIGATASAGTIIASGGSYRKMSQTARYLAHQSMFPRGGNATELKAKLQTLEQNDSLQVEAYKSMAVNKSEQEIRDLMAKNMWITAEEAKDWGFVHEVYKPMRAVAQVENDELIAAGLPPLPEIYQNKMENNEKTLKDTILAAIGFKNDDAIVAENTSLKQEVETVKAQVSQVEADKNAEIESVKAKVITAETALANKQAELDAKIAEIETINAKVTTLESDLAKAKAGRIDNGGSDPD